MQRAYMGLVVLVLSSPSCTSPSGKGQSRDAGPPLDASTTEPPTSDAMSARLDSGRKSNFESEPVPSGEYAAGERLTPVYWHIGDSEPVFYEWYDRALQANCSFVLIDGSVPRCTPSSNALLAYVDDGCNEAVAAVYSGCNEQPTQFVWQTESVCPLQGQLFRVGMQREAPVDALYERTSDGICRQLNYDLQDFRVFALGPRVLPEELVSERRFIHAGDGALRALYREASDGSHERLGWFDVGQRMECIPRRGTPGDHACVPFPQASVARTEMGTDCKTPVVAVRACGTYGDFALDVKYENCESTYDVVKLEGSLGPWVGIASQGQCLTAESPYDTYRSATPIDITGAPMLHVDHLDKGRLRVLNESAKGLPSYDRWWSRGLFEDAQLGDSCYPQRAADGKQRCLPGSSEYGDYADAECKRPMIELSEPGPCTPMTRFVTRFDANAKCDTEHVFALGAPVAEGAPVYAQTDSGCKQVRNAPAHAYLLGDELDPQTFAEVTTSP